MNQVTATDAKMIRELSSRLGSVEFRQLLTGEGQRLMRPERLENLSTGKGKISDEEMARLQTIHTNSAAVKNLLRKGAGKKRPYRTRRAVRDWLYNGKDKGVDYQSQDTETKEAQLKAIRALRFLGVDPSEGTYYVRKRKR